jgi:transposase
MYCGDGNHSPEIRRYRASLAAPAGNETLPSLQASNTILVVAENGCKWRALPKRHGNWHSICIGVYRWASAGVLQRLFEERQRERLFCRLKGSRRNFLRCDGLGLMFIDVIHFASVVVSLR